MKPKHILIMAVTAVALIQSALAKPALPEFKSREEIRSIRAEQATQRRSDQAENAPSAVAEAFFYTGKIGESGEYLFKYRNYNAELGRWGASDPSGFPDGANNRVYINNMPVTCLDAEALNIWHINDSSNVYGNGHSAMVVGNEQAGYHYRSLDSNGNVDFGSASTWGEMQNILANPAGTFADGHSYDRWQSWETSPEQDQLALNEANSWHGTGYNVLTNNCWDMVNAALIAAGVDSVDSGPIPNVNFIANAEFANGGSGAIE